MKKALWTLSVQNYAPDIRALTFPLLERYAAKIGADFRVLTERKHPERPPVYEKLQIYELGRDYDWNIYIDADALVHPDMFDVTDHLHRDTVCHNAVDMAGNRWRYDDYFRRDGRHIGSCNWFTVASSWCRDLWHPLDDLTYEQALDNIRPIAAEVAAGITRDHLIDDYILSRNIARFGLKFTTVNDILKKLGDQGSYLWHQYVIPTHEKPAAIKAVLAAWNVEV